MEGKENKFFLIFIVVIVCALLFALFWVSKMGRDILPATHPATQSDDAKSVKALVEVPTVTDEKIVSTDQAKQYDIEVHFPKLLLASHPELAKDANTVIAAFVEDSVNSFKKDVEENSSPDIPKDFTSDLSIRWSALLLSPTIISLRFDESEYIAGAAHPNSQTRVLNYDLEKHLLIGTSELFASTTQALPFYSTYTRGVLASTLGEQIDETYKSMTLPGTEPTNENFSVVGITKTGLLIIFPPYQVAPYARGSVEVTIPLSSLDSLLSARVTDAISMATNNIIEATPEATTSTENGLNQ